MPFSNKRNSRDDKSGKSKQSFSGKSFDKKNQKFDKKENSPFGQKTRDTNIDQDKSYGRPKKAWSDKDGETSESRNNKYQAKGSAKFGPKRRDDNVDRDKSYDRPRKVWENREGKTSDIKSERYPTKEDGKAFSQKRRNDSADREGSYDRPKKNWIEKGGKTPDHRYNKYPSKADGKTFDKRKRTDSIGGDKTYDKSARKTWTDREGDVKRSTERFKTQRFSKDREDDGLVRLNRYIANSGICSRRKADELIQAGVVTVNGAVVTELGTKVDASKDEIRYNGEKLKREKMVYVLLNKPKDYITTTDDPQERRTVMHLVEKASKERIYPVGRLDRNTTGLLLLTNDGNLAEKLSHPRNSIMKIYQIELNKNLTQGDLNKISFGLELEDGFIKPDEVTYVQGASKREVGIQIHSGKNRIVRRIFESLGYDVVKLDRVIYANLTKKDLPRGRWRYLEEKEIIQLKHFIK